MKILEFRTHMNADHTVTVPQEIAEQIEEKQPVRVLLVLPDTDADRDWSNLTAEQFLKVHHQLKAHAKSEGGSLNQYSRQ